MANSNALSSAAPTASARPDWFRSRGGRRYGRDIAVLLVLKLVLLALLWALAVRPAPRADTSPAAVAHHLGGATGPVPAPEGGGP
ncbi:MAG: hypothetical protein JSR18_06855 [Proteobacteria bacterium]|nr:hypothetical protein [Pseudomonadota bacterium]